MEKLSNTEAELKNNVTYKKNMDVKNVDGPNKHYGSTISNSLSTPTSSPKSKIISDLEKSLSLLQNLWRIESLSLKISLLELGMAILKKNINPLIIMIMIILIMIILIMIILVMIFVLIIEKSYF